MELNDIFISQYRASFAMLRQAVLRCPDTIWTDERYKNRFWHVAYHALCCSHLYLQDSPESFIPWERHREDYQFLGPLPWPPHREPNIGEPYAREDILDYIGVCTNEAGARIPQLDPDAESGFFWLPFTKAELQLYNIRHIQHHTGQLIDRLRTDADISVDWIAIDTE